MTETEGPSPGEASATDLRQLAAAAAHEIRNPLNTMAIHCELLESRLRRLTSALPGPESKEAQDALLRSVGSLSKEVERIDRTLAHFLAHATELPGVYIDMFHGGRLLSEHECRTLLRQKTQGAVEFERSMLEPIGARQILLRMLQNLKRTHMRRGALDRALAASDRILLLAPGQVDELRDRGVFADVVPADSTNEGIVAALMNVVKAGDRVLLPRARVARELLPETLRAAGVHVDVVAVYETLGPDDATREVLRHALLGDTEQDGMPAVDTVAFTSSSTVSNLIDALTVSGLDARALLSTRTLLSIGPITSATLRAAGLEPTLEASPHTIAAMVDLLERDALTRTKS